MAIDGDRFRVMITDWKLPASTQWMKPPIAVLFSAVENVAHGAARVHGLLLLPVLETHVRSTCA
jgi:hypothetical protein